MKNINTDKLANTCDTIVKRCTEIAGTHNGSAWLFNNMIKIFKSSDAVVSVTISVFIDDPVMLPGEAVIGRDGSLRMYTVTSKTSNFL